MIFLQKPTVFSPKFKVVSCFVEAEGHILLLHRQDHKPQGNTWCVPAGKVDDNEDPVTALLRELFQETGHLAMPHELELIEKVFVCYPDSHFTFEMFRLRLTRKFEVILSRDEHKDFRWVTPQVALAMKLIPDEDACIKLAYGIS